MATHFKGPVISANGFVGNITGNVTGNISGTVTGAIAATTITASASLAVGATPATIKKIGSGVVSVNAGTLAAQTAVDVSVTITGAAPGDIVQIMPLDASMEAGLAVQAVWVSATSTVKIRLFNNNAVVALTGGAQNWTYLWTDLT